MKILRKKISKNEKGIVILELYTGKMVKDTQETANISVSCLRTKVFLKGQNYCRLTLMEAQKCKDSKNRGG